MSDAFQEDDDARRAYELAAAESDRCDREINDLLAKKRAATGPIDRRIAIRNDERQRSLDDVRDSYESLVRQIVNAAAADVNALIGERRRLEDAVDAKLPAIRTEQERWNAKRFFSAGDYRLAQRRTESIRMIDVMQFTAFLRLHPDHPASADRMVDWLHKNIRPFVLEVTAETDRRFRYRLSTVRGHIVVDLPSASRPNGRMMYQRSADYQPEYAYAVFRLTDAPWLADPPAKSPDRFDFGRFVLATSLTAPRRLLRHSVSDRSRPSNPSWIDKIELKLLHRHTLIPTNRYNAGLLERWLPSLPTVICRLVFEYRD